MRYLRSRRPRPYLRKRKKNFIPLIIFIFFVGLVLWTGKILFSAIFSGVRTETVSAKIKIFDGRAEFSLAETDTWSPAYTDQKFFKGDKIKTSTSTRVSLEMFGGNMLFLDSNSEIEFLELEQNYSGEKNIHIKIYRGQIWGRISESDFGKDKNSEFVILTDRVKTKAKGAILNFSVNDNQDSIRVVKGHIAVDVFLPDEKTKNINLSVGQKLIINPKNIQNIGDGQEVVEILDKGFIESEWHLKNLEHFFPQEVGQIRRNIEISYQNSVEKKEVVQDIPESEDIKSPEILSPVDGTVIPASEDLVQIIGTAPENAVQITVNNYTLSKFRPGDRKWSYFAAKKFGTLLPGKNTFSIVAISNDGKKSKPTLLNITYEGTVKNTSLIKKTNNVANDINFKKPIILKPFIANKTDVYQTSASVVTISGEVDPQTKSVEVNGFRLEKFKPGDIRFSYIANANYGNLKKGDNIFKVVAIGPNGQIAESQIKIFYSPIEK